MKLKDVPALILFLVLILICVGSLGLAGYVELLQSTPPTEKQHSVCGGLLMLAFLSGLGSLFLATAFSEGD